MRTITVTDETTPAELREAIGYLVAESRKIETLIETAADTKTAHVYRIRWDRLAEKIEVLCEEVRERT